MKKLLTPLLVLMLVGCQQASTGAKLEQKEVDVTENEETATPIEVVPTPKLQWTCPTCDPNEQYVLRELQDSAGIEDKNALAAILGNIKQESKFLPNICEGGARVPYHHCHSGGYGLIQWTTKSRYDGLGFFARKYGCDPSTLECQTRYLINEIHFQKVLPEFKNPGFGIHQYMVPSYYWLGWGIEGPRVSYSHQYASQLVKA